MTVPQALQLAIQRHEAGQLAEAEALYRQILAVQPTHADALHYLGVIAQQVGRHELAVEWIRRAIASNPQNPVAYSNLGVACRAMGRRDEAIDAFRQALQLKPDYPEAHNNLGNALRQQNRFDEAMAAYRRALELKPGYLEAHNNLGSALKDLGRLDEAIAAYHRVIELQPNYAEAHNNLGVALAEQGRLEEAMTSYRRAIELRPGYPEAHNNLGAALKDTGRLDQAVAVYRRALEINADYPEAHNNLGNALAEQSRLDEAMASYRRALELKPDYLEAHNNLGVALKDQGELEESIASFRRALQLQPDNPEAHNNLGNAFKDQGALDEAIASYRRAVQLRPEYAWAHSNLVFTLHFHPDQAGANISEEQYRWNRQFGDPVKAAPQPHANNRNPERRLRIGYVSPDFRDHAVGRFLLPLFERHDRERFEIHCYSGIARSDAMTQRFRTLATGWRNTVGVPDAGLAGMIREDGVDILVDLALHTAGNRLPMFAYKPAPVQVTWLAYAGSSGLQSIDYRLTDAYMDPPEGGDAREGETLPPSPCDNPAWSAEKPVRLPDCWCCYQPEGESPEVNALPALSSQGITFGSLNNFTKVHQGVLELWSRALEAVEGSRLLMFCPEGRSRERVRAFLNSRTIAPERVEFAGLLPRQEYLNLYHRIDLGFDPFPYNGMTTTCDALWMGVPVLTLPGKFPASRAGLSLLSNIGLGEFAISSEEEYLQIAIKLARDLPRLAHLRATLRPRMQASPLMNAPQFAKNVESAYRSMWRHWCATP